MKTEKYKKVKRIFDITVSVAGLILVSPLMGIVALAIKLESRGPVVYSSKRVGQDYKIFGLLKFRSMYSFADTQVELLKTMNQYQNTNLPIIDGDGCPFCKLLQHACSPLLISDEETICENYYKMRKDADRSATFFKINNDPRVTRVGKFIRRTSIDELPQLINIIRGDMSLIGNRPLPLYEAEKLTTDHAIERFNAPSGLTGLWQVTKRGKGEMTELERIELDKIYARQWSLRTDLKILLKTFPALFQEKNV